MSTAAATQIGWPRFRDSVRGVPVTGNSGGWQLDRRKVLAISVYCQTFRVFFSKGKADSTGFDPICEPDKRGIFWMWQHGWRSPRLAG